MTQDALGMKGELHIKLVSESGEVKKDVTIPNLIVTAGKNYVASALVITPPAVFVSMAVGTGTTTPALADSALQAEVARVVFSNTVAVNVTTLTATFGAGVGTAALTEAGLFTSAVASSGTLLSHVTFAAVNKGASDVLTITWTITCG